MSKTIQQQFEAVLADLRARGFSKDEIRITEQALVKGALIAYKALLKTSTKQLALEELAELEEQQL